MVIAATVALALQSMPLPPPGQIAEGAGAIPENRNAPIFPWLRQTVPGADWDCRPAGPEMASVRIAGHFDRFEVIPSNGAVPAWPAYAIARVNRDASHGFAGVYLATYSHNIYGFRLANGGQAYELTVRFREGGPAPWIEIRKYTPGAPDWVEIGRGACAVRIEQEGGASG